jgi:hypothetical protein
MEQLNTLKPRQSKIATIKAVHGANKFASLETLLDIHAQITKEPDKKAVHELIRELIQRFNSDLQKEFEKEKHIVVAAFGETDEYALTLDIWTEELWLGTIQTIWGNMVVLMK